MMICKGCFREWRDKNHKFCPRCRADGVLPPGEKGKPARFDALTGQPLARQRTRIRYEIVAAVLAVGILGGLLYAMFGQSPSAPPAPVATIVTTPTTVTADLPRFVDPRLPATMATVASADHSASYAFNSAQSPIDTGGTVKSPITSPNKPSATLPFVQPPVLVVRETTKPVAVASASKVPDITPPVIPMPATSPAQQLVQVTPKPDPKPPVVVQPTIVKPPVAPTPPKPAPVDVPALLRAGNVALQENRVDQAVEAFDKVLAVQPGSAEALSGRAKASDVMYGYANRYAAGTDVRRDPNQAAIWYRRAAVLGNRGAQRALGDCYSQEQGVPRDGKLAQQWYHNAFEQYRALADKGDLDAKIVEGEMYEAGQGVTADPVAAYNLYRAAADVAAAKRHVGLCYLKGFGDRPANKKDGIYWLQKAAKQNDAEAQRILSEMNEKW